MQIDLMSYDFGTAIYYDDEFRSVLEDHMTNLRTSSTTTTLTVDEHAALVVYKYDFYGLLAFYNVPYQLHWITLRMNNMKNRADPIPSSLVLLIPNQRYVDQIRSSHMTTRVIS